MGRSVSNISKERLIRSRLGVVSDKRRRFVADRVGEEKAFGKLVVRNMLVIAGQRVRLPVVGSPCNNPEIAIEATLTGPTVFRSGPDRYAGRCATCRSCRFDIPQV